MRGSQVRLSEYFTATMTGNTTEDAFGTVTGTDESFNFFGHVSEMKSDRLDDQGKRRDRRHIKVIARADDVTDITIKHRLTYAGETREYVATDIYEADFEDRQIESKFKSYKTIEAKYVR